jgi:hypothetical protein
VRLLARPAGEVRKHLCRVESGVPALEGDDHAAVLGAVLLAETVEVDGEIGVVPGEDSHVLSPARRPVSGLCRRR